MFLNLLFHYNVLTFFYFIQCLRFGSFTWYYIWNQYCYDGWGFDFHSKKFVICDKIRCDVGYRHAVLTTEDLKKKFSLPIFLIFQILNVILNSIYTKYLYINKTLICLWTHCTYFNYLHIFYILIIVCILTSIDFRVRKSYTISKAYRIYLLNSYGGEEISKLNIRRFHQYF